MNKAVEMREIAIKSRGTIDARIEMEYEMILKMIHEVSLSGSCSMKYNGHIRDKTIKKLRADGFIVSPFDVNKLTIIHWNV